MSSNLYIWTSNNVGFTTYPRILTHLVSKYLLNSLLKNSNTFIFHNKSDSLYVLPSPSMVHLLRSTVLELITPTTGKPSTSPAGSLGMKQMLLPSSGATAAGWGS